MTSWIGYVGLVALALCWVPQVTQTIREGICKVNASFLALSALGSICLGLYAVLIGDTVFIVLNSLTTTGAGINLYYRFFPRSA